MRPGETWYERADACIVLILFLLVFGGMLVVGGICVGLDAMVGAKPVWRRGS